MYLINHDDSLLLLKGNVKALLGIFPLLLDINAVVEKIVEVISSQLSSVIRIFLDNFIFPLYNSKD